MVKSLSKDLSLHEEFNADLQECAASLKDDAKITKDKLYKQQNERALIEKEYEEKKFDLKYIVLHYETSSQSYETQLQIAKHD